MPAIIGKYSQLSKPPTSKSTSWQEMLPHPMIRSTLPMSPSPNPLRSPGSHWITMNDSVLSKENGIALF